MNDINNLLPTYYVIMKDVQVHDSVKGHLIGFGPLEVTTDEQLAKKHIASLNKYKDKIENRIKEANPTMIEFSFELRIFEMTPTDNETAARIINEYSEQKAQPQPTNTIS